MPTIDSTVKGPDANSYVDVADADDYFGTRLHTEAWDAITDPTIKEKALLMAARTLDTRVRWKGTKTTVEQAMQWPRYGVEDVHSSEDGAWYPYDLDSIPLQIMEAQMELALSLLSTDRTIEGDSKGLRSISVGEIAMEFDKADVPSVFPPSVTDLIDTFAVSYPKTGGGYLSAPVVRV